MMYQPDPNDEMPDWLQDLPDDTGDDSKSESPVSPPEDQATLDDQTAQEDQTTPEEQAPPEENGELGLDTGWLDDLIEEADENVQDKIIDDTPEWLKNIRELKRVTGTLTLPDDEHSKDPVWLEKLGLDSNQEEDSAEKPAEEADIHKEQLDEILSVIESKTDADGETPEWLQKIRQEQGDPGKQPVSEEDSDRSGWLDSIRDKHFEDTQKHEVISDKTEEEIVKKEPASPEKRTPDWLHGLEEKSSIHQSQKQERDKPINDLPEWLQDIMAGTSEEEIKLDIPLPEVEPHLSTEDEIISSEDPVPDETPKEEDWIDKFRLDGIKISQEDLPEWVFEPADTPEIKEIEPSDTSEVEEFEPSETSEIEEFEPSKTSEIVEEEVPELEAAKIPTWLDDFVPENILDTDSSPKDQAKGHYLKGPLLELDHPLPLEPAIKKISPPNIPTQDILLTDIQEKHVSYIFDLIKSESAGQKIGSRRVFVPQPLLQTLIALALMIGIIFSFLGQKNMIKPDSAPVNVQQFVHDIEDLTAGDNVLVAVDYQASFAGELENGAGQIMNQILSTGANINFISSNPIGPGLIDHLVSSHLPAELQEPDQSYFSLGYISGGSAALLHFAENPKETTAAHIEEYPNLSSISSIKDYSMVLVITDDLNNARSWLEQVQPKITGTISHENQLPFLMLTSSQLEALIHPYYATSPQKLNGYLSGLKAMSQFESLSSSEPENDLWNGYSRGISTTFLILIAGSAYYFINSKFLNKQRQQDI